MDTHDTSSEISAAMNLWPDLFTFASRSWELSGRGAVLMEREALRSHEADDPPPGMNYIAAADVPSGDDFQSLMLQYEPTKQVVLILGGGTLDEIAMVIEPSGS